MTKPRKKSHAIFYGEAKAEHKLPISFDSAYDKRTALRLLQELRDGASGQRAITAALVRILKRAEFQETH